MMQLPSTPPVFISNQDVQVGILQHIQQLVEHPGLATLADAQILLNAMQQAYGSATTLEHVIQHQVGQQLQRQRWQKLEVLR